MEIFSKTEGSTFYFQSPLPYLCTCTITVDAKRKDPVEERKSERQMKIETSRKFLDCAIKMELRVVAIKVSRCQHGKQRKVLGSIVLKYFKAYRQGFFLPCHSRRKFVWGMRTVFFRRRLTFIKIVAYQNDIFSILLTLKKKIAFLYKFGK